MQSSEFTFSVDMDMEAPDFELPPEVAALPTSELQFWGLLYMADKGILLSLPTSQLVSGDRIQK